MRALPLVLMDVATNATPRELASLFAHALKSNQHDDAAEQEDDNADIRCLRPHDRSEPDRYKRRYDELNEKARSYHLIPAQAASRRRLRIFSHQSEFISVLLRCNAV